MSRHLPRNHLGHADHERAVLVGAGLHHQCVVEARETILRRVGHVLQRRVVATEDQFDALQTHLAVSLGPAPVVADHHAHATAERVPHTETLVARLEVVALRVLERPPRFVRGVTGDVHLAILRDDPAISVDEHLRVVPVTICGEFCVSERESDATLLGELKQRGSVGTRHRAFVVVVGGRDVVDEPAREERRQCEFGEDDERDAKIRRTIQQRTEPRYGIGASMFALDGPHLRGGNSHDTGFAAQCAAHQNFDSASCSITSSNTLAPATRSTSSVCSATL